VILLSFKGWSAMKRGWVLSVGILVIAVICGGCGSASKPTTPQCLLNSDCAKLSTPGLVCALGFCVTPCRISSDCPNSERCVIVSSALAAGSDGGSMDAGDTSGEIQGTACQAPETVACQYNSQCRAPLVCGSDHQCRDMCETAVDCPMQQVCTSLTKLCADPTLDKDYSTASNDFVAGAAGAGGSNGTDGAAPADAGGIGSGDASADGPAGRGITSVVAPPGGSYACALTAAGNAWCWGKNLNSQLGDGTTNVSSVKQPVEVKNGLGTAGNLAGIVQIAVGESHACALLRDGSVWCWGANTGGALGVGTMTTSPYPVEVKGLGGVGFLTGSTWIAAGGEGNEYSCALLADGYPRCWGSNADGQLGVGNSVGHLFPTPVNLPGCVDISAGPQATCARVGSGAVWCWGFNSQGLLGVGMTALMVTTPAEVMVSAGGGPLSADAPVSVGGSTQCAVVGGNVWCWGSPQKPPTQVLDGTTGSPFRSVTSVSAGSDHSCAIVSGGSIWCWGNNSNGQLGDATTTARAFPVKVLDLTGVAATEVVVGADFSCALKIDGTLSCWGNNTWGQLGNSTMTQVSSPEPVVFP
jgi:alpha-tubulin suppressor-like RCC1 family protein